MHELQCKHYSQVSGLTELDPVFEGTGVPSEVEKLKKTYPELYVPKLSLYHFHQIPQKNLGPYEYRGKIFGKVLVKGTQDYNFFLTVAIGDVNSRYGTDRNAVNLAFLKLAKEMEYEAVDLGNLGIVAFYSLPVVQVVSEKIPAVFE